MGAAAPDGERLELGWKHRAFVVAALICNAALIVLEAAVGEPYYALVLLVFGALPAFLLALQARPSAFRWCAGLLGLFYVGPMVIAGFVAGAFFVLAGLLLLCAALWRSPTAGRTESNGS